LSNRELLGIGNDDAPIRLIVLQLLYLLNRRLNVTADGYGLKPSLKAYLSQFSAPKFEIGVGNVDLINLEKPVEAATESEAISSRYEAARDQTTVLMPVVKSPPEPPADAIAPAADPEPVAEVAAAEPPPEPLPDTIVPAAEPETAAEAVVFDKPSPFASAPVLPVEDPAPAAEAPPQSSPAPAAPLGSAPISSTEPATSTAEEPPPSMEPAASTAEAPPANDVAPPKPRVDINLDSAGDGAKENEVEAEEDEFLDTVIIPPNALASSNDSGGNSTNAFIARVKEQLTTSESVAANGKDSFSSTIPQ
jgi:hypothetical protein